MRRKGNLLVPNLTQVLTKVSSTSKSQVKYGMHVLQTQRLYSKGISTQITSKQDDPKISKTPTAGTRHASYIVGRKTRENTVEQL